MNTLTFPGLRRDVPLSEYTTFKVGGKADYFLEVSSASEIVGVIQKARSAEIPFRIIAGGSNLVCAENLPGLTLRIVSRDITFVSDTIVQVSAGVTLMDLVNASISRGLAGLETLSGIPGTVGGAVVGNAGAYGRSIGESVARVEIFDGELVRWITREECHFGYRDSVFKHQPWVVLSVELSLSLSVGESSALTARSQEIVALREKKYPPGLRCPGSFYKNVLVADLSPEILAKIDPKKVIEGKVPTGYLLEAVGACGKRTEHLLIPTYHGNLIINEGGATLAEVQEFSALLKGLVRSRFGIELEEEVRYIT